MKAYLGKYNLSDENEIGSRSHLVHEIIIHPDWKFNHHKFDADIAVLVLEDATSFDIFVHSVCLPVRSSDTVTGTGTVVGWGKSESSNGHFEPTPFQLQVPVIDAAHCYTNFPKLAKYSSTRMFCGGYDNQGKAPCGGDSGGGMHFMSEAATWTIRGVVSGGLMTALGGCDVDSYTLYTDVAQFLDWIAEVMERTQTTEVEKLEFKCDIIVSG